MDVRRGKNRKSDSFPVVPNVHKFIEFFESNGFTKLVPPFPDTVYWPSKLIREAEKMECNAYSLGQYYAKIPESHFVLFSDGMLCFKLYTDTGVRPGYDNFSVYYLTKREPLKKFTDFDVFRDYVIDYLYRK